jgi:superfamily II DNA or RNA helicase
MPDQNLELPLGEPQPLNLPEIIHRPIQIAVGEIACVLRPAERAVATQQGEIAISAKIKEPLYALENGETFILTSRKRVERPAGVDGVLQILPDGRFVWQSHKLREDFEKGGVARGWSAIVSDRAKQWDGQFSFRTERPDADGGVPAGKEGIRPPQIGALHAIGAHWSLHAQPATIVMPTGTGKTETMLATLAVYVRKPLLVVVPWKALRGQTANKFLRFGLLRALKVLAADAPNPVVGILKKIPKNAAALEIFERCNVIIGTMDSLADLDAEPMWPKIAERIGALIIDEARHIGATRWTKFRGAFSEIPVLQFTATPFRRDGELVDGQLIYTYPLARAQADKYFKHITFEPVYEPTPSKADAVIAEAAVAKLREDLANGLNHLLMARCSSIDRAKAVSRIYKTSASDLNPILVHSDEPGAEKRIKELREGKSRIVVCVNMLGEGFDLPQLKIAAVHDLHKSLGILLQFTGRFTRSAAKDIGDATVIANIAEPNVSAALERLYSEDADWNELLSELSSDAAQEHARLIAFLNDVQRLDVDTPDDDIAITHKLLRPTLSTLFYESDKFSPKRFFEGLPEGLVPYRVWLHAKSNTLFFVTRSEPSLKWIRSKAVYDRSWALFVLHFDEKRKLLYLASTDKDSLFDGLAKAVGATRILSGDIVFRAMGRINRLTFQNVGVKKHGRRNLSYASYTGAEVVSALGLAEKSGSVKALLSGMGWEGGKQVTIGCSVKGRVWSREAGSIPRFIEWCEEVGDKLRDTSIETAKLIDNVLLPTEVTTLPNLEILNIEWPVEILRQIEERVVFSSGTREHSQTTCELVVLGVDRSANAIDFELLEVSEGSFGQFRFTLGGVQEFGVTQTAGTKIHVKIGNLASPLEEYFSNYPPLFRFVDLSELDANLHITPQTPYELRISDDRFTSWNWSNVDMTKETIWKDGVERRDSIQWHAAKHFDDFDVVFDDDASGEAADLVCIKEGPDAIRVALVHCKFSGGATAGERIKDVVEVSSQAVRSARWIGKFPQLARHLHARNEALKNAARPTRFLKGTNQDLNRLVKAYRFRPIQAEIAIVQPGLSKTKRTPAQSIVLAAALTYVKETVGVDIDIYCST